MKSFRQMRWLMLAAVIGTTAMVAGAGSAGAASSGASATTAATNVGQALSGASGVVGGLSGSLGANGGYGDQPNAGSVPFLGGSPGSLLSGLFDGLGGLSGFNGFAPADDDSISVVKTKVDAVDSALGGGKLLDRVYTCGAAACTDSSKVKDITSIELRLATSGKKTGDIDFTSLNLPSLGFVPKDAQKLHVDLSWSANVKLIADGSGLRLAPVDSAHELTLGAAIKLPTNAFNIDLGALVVKATTTTQPEFDGTLQVDLEGNGGFSFGFGDPSQFKAGWHLKTEKSPLMGVEGDLNINWPLQGGGVNAGELKINFDNLTIDTSEFVGKDIQEAAGAIREVTHPIRTVTSPLLEPIPGMSDISAVLGGDDVTMLKLMETAGFNTDLRKLLEKLQAVDDAVSALSGGGNVNLGSFTLVGNDALTPADQPFGDAIKNKLKEKLKNIYDECGQDCRKRINDFLTAVNGSPTPDEGGFKFDLPVLRDPATLAGMLLGRDVDLITFDTGRLGYSDTLNIPLARFLIFAVKLAGPVDATIDLKGGVDTRGIADAIKSGGDSADVLNGVYLQRPTDGQPLIWLRSGVQLDFTAGIEVVEVSIGGGPKLDVRLNVPASPPADKLRPALANEGDGIGCELLKADDAIANFFVNITAKFKYLIGEEEETLAEHTFFTREDLCEKAANDTPVAHPEGTNIVVNPASMRGIPTDKPDTIKVFMIHDETGAPKTIVVQGNNNQRSEFPAADFKNVMYESPESDFLRPVIFRVVKTDGKPFEKTLSIKTGDGPDDVLIDSEIFSNVQVNGGDDKVILTSGGDSLVSGGEGSDYLAGGDNHDFLGGGAGDDRIDGGGNFDVLNGGNDNDLLYDSSPDGNCLSGGDGNDQLLDGPGADFLNGDDTVVCGQINDPDPRDDGSLTNGDDVIVTGGGGDFVVAGNGKDEVKLFQGNVKAIYNPDDAVWDAGETVYGNGGADHIKTGDGGDSIHGGSGDDVIAADAGPHDALALRSGGNDTVYGDNGTDKCVLPIVGQPTEADTVGAADTVHGGDGADAIALEAGADRAWGGGNGDAICGHAGVDTIDGGDEDSGFLPVGGAGDGDDTVFGGTAGDTINGGPGGDELYGNDGSDTMNGGGNNDRMVGGSSAAATADTGDTLNGDDGLDVIIGDNGEISNATPRAPRVFDLFANDATLGGADTIGGGGEDDRAFGGIAGDTIRGGAGADHLEGNNGDDGISGEADQDDLIGGTSPESLPNPAAGQAAADAPDVGETLLSGGAERDVIAGDNAIITRPGGTDPIIGGSARSVTLLDRDRSGSALDAVSGGDYVEGNEASDRLYGEGGADYMKGNDADDFAEGNQGADRLEGNDGEDDLIGGSSFTSSPGVGDPDAGDQLAGGGGADVMLGDNAAVTRATTGSGSGFDWDSVANNWLGPNARRSITLLDKATLAPANFGIDTLSGGAGEDVGFGQDGNDRLYGGSHDDYLEGNGGADVIFGDGVALPTGNSHESLPPQLDGVAGPDGQDDEIGGSSWIKSTASNGAVTGQRDAADELHGDGNADVQLGDNGKVLRRIAGASYETYQAKTGKPTIVRQAASTGSAATALPARFDVSAPASAGVWGDDTLYGEGGDDLQLAEDGNDTLFGGAADDDMYGELGSDRMFGEPGEDAMLGDRGVVTNTLMATGAAFSTSGPPQISFTPYAAHPLDRRVDMNDDGDGAPLQSPGMTAGGADFMRGGPDHDAMHGEAGNDLMNGDSGGDYLFGDDGVDVIWGGKGRECADPAELACNADHGSSDTYLDYLFGGNGLKTDPVTGGADILDFRPRPGVDPAAWFEITSTNAGDPADIHQHHQGVDWIYGGWDRDVMQADIADNGPNQGDHLLDWTGTYNLYDHCPAAYGGYNDVRQFSPDMQTFLQKLAYYLGAGKSLADVQTKGTSGYNDLALVYNADVKNNSGSAYPTTPGHFDQFSCAP